MLRFKLFKLCVVLAFCFALPSVASAKVCFNYADIISLAGSLVNPKKSSQTPTAAPKPREVSVRPTTPVANQVPAQERYLGDGIYETRDIKAQEQSAYDASRAAMNHPKPLPVPQPPAPPSPSTTTTRTRGSSSGSSTSSPSLGTIISDITGCATGQICI